MQVLRVQIAISIFVYVSKPKDYLDPRLKHNVCYQISCDCWEIYVGEMGRVAEIRWGEHKKLWEDAIKKCKDKNG